MFETKVIVAVAALCSTVAAEAACWSPRAAAAAQVRELDALMMVSALRCRFTDPGLLVRYNAFVVRERSALLQANAELKAHFSAEVGAAAALNAFDRFSTQLANRYGAGVEGLACGDVTAIVDAATGEGRGFAGLAAIAERAEIRPSLAGGACEATEFAARRP